MGFYICQENKRRGQGIGVCLFSVKIPLVAAYFEEKIYHEVEKVKEVEEKKAKKGLENKNFFDFFDLAVKISSKT
ncbi:MAG: hypothetical protein LBL44_11975 [Treponema sp.]|nr:hypothetical protein [Treponema sp.]